MTGNANWTSHQHIPKYYFDNIEIRWKGNRRNFHVTHNLFHQGYKSLSCYFTKKTISDVYPFSGEASSNSSALLHPHKVLEFIYRSSTFSDSWIDLQVVHEKAVSRDDIPGESLGHSLKGKVALQVSDHGYCFKCRKVMAAQVSSGSMTDW